MAHVHDLTDLPAPEPFERAMHLVAALGPGETVAVRTPRVPRMLLPRLVERGLTFEVEEHGDGTATVTIARPNPDAG